MVDLVRGPLQSVGKTLADLGAEVLLVEPEGGSVARRTGVVRGDTSLTFAVLNRGKRSVVADPSTSDGRRTLDALLADADLCLMDARPSELGAFADPEWIRSRYSRLAVVSMTDFGRSGPRSGWSATPDVHAAISTALSRSGLPSVDHPLLPPEFLASGAASAQGLFAALVALYQSLRTGTGEYVDFSVSEALMHVLDPAFGIGGTARVGLSVRDLPRGRPDAGHMYPVFRTLDGWVRICVLSPRQWAGMFEWLGRPERFADARYTDTQTRFDAAAELYPSIAALFAGLTKDAAAELGQSFGVPTAALLSVSEVLESEHYGAAGSFGAVRAGDLDLVAPTGVFDLDGAHVGADAPAPELDEARELARETRVRRDTNLSPTGILPFEGLRVLDLGVIVMGGELGRLFADLGAEVIKIESRSFPDGSRLAGDITESFAWGHRNKLSMGLDLTSDDGRVAFTELVRRSDVVLTNFKPGTLQKLGFGYGTLKAINPRVILSESSAFGNGGPWSGRMGYGPLVRASAGLSLLWQYPDIEGSFSDAITIYPDHAVARLNAAAIIALLIRRGHTGLGGSVSTAQVDAILDAMAVEIALESVEPGSVRAAGNRRDGDAPRGIFPAAGDDEWAVIDVQGGDVFAALARVVGHSEWTADPRFATASGRLEAAAEIRAGVEEWTRRLSSSEVASRLQQAGVPAGDMKRTEDLVDDAHLAERNTLGVLQQPQLGGPLPAFASETTFETIPEPRLRPAPSQGEHTRRLAERLLDWGPQQIEAAIVAGALEVGEAETARPERADA
ncbi:putative CoA-transferase [Frondihabitans sucicola]|uniref:CoA-transferase n=1 Tax=Frondihabitans sucicola TaxID=1268041 RepID=A0ABM8GKE0_9MICO|nr:putative CoA-transferase [Frondihabitans sucicola]